MARHRCGHLRYDGIRATVDRLVGRASRCCWFACPTGTTGLHACLATQYVLRLDVASSLIKGLLFDLDGRVLDPEALAERSDQIGQGDVTVDAGR